MTAGCDRARSLVSQGLDGPLHELEDRFVTAHLARCGACRAFAEDARAFTSLLRSAPYEPVPWPAHAAAPRRRTRVGALAQIASVASMIVIAGGIALGQERPFQGAERPLVAAQGADPALADESIRLLQREALASGVLHILPVADAPAGTAPAGVKPALPVEVR